jgi:outer membrane lipoprotein SlyB
MMATDQGNAVLTIDFYVSLGDSISDNDHYATSDAAQKGLLSGGTIHTVRHLQLPQAKVAAGTANGARAGALSTHGPSAPTGTTQTPSSRT